MRAELHQDGRSSRSGSFCCFLPLTSCRVSNVAQCSVMLLLASGLALILPLCLIVVLGILQTVLESYAMPPLCHTLSALCSIAAPLLSYPCLLLSEYDIASLFMISRECACARRPGLPQACRSGKLACLALQAVLSTHVACAPRLRLRQSFSRTLTSQKT